MEQELFYARKNKTFPVLKNRKQTLLFSREKKRQNQKLFKVNFRLYPYNKRLLNPNSVRNLLVSGARTLEHKRQQQENSAFFKTKDEKK